MLRDVLFELLQIGLSVVVAEEIRKASSLQLWSDEETVVHYLLKKLQINVDEGLDC